MRILLCFLLIFSNLSFANLTCLNPLQDPKEIAYAKKLSDIADYVEKAPQKLLQLKERNRQIENRLQELNRILPRLERELSTDGSGTMFRELEISKADLSQAQTQASTLREQRKREAEQNYAREISALERQEAELQRMRQGSELAYRTAEDTLTAQKRSALEAYQNAVNELTQRRNIEARRILNRPGQISEALRAQVLDSTKSLEQSINQEEAKRDQRLSQIELELAALHGRKAESQRLLQSQEDEIQRKKEVLRETHESTLASIDQDYRNQGQARKQQELERLTRVKSQLQSPYNRFLAEKQRLEQEQNEILNGKPLPTRPRPQGHERPLSEKLFDYHGIKQLEENIGKHLGTDSSGQPLFSTDGRFEMIKRWWKEQGKQNRQKRLATEAQATVECKDCSKVQAIPIPEFSSRLKKECVVLSMSSLTNETPQYYCEDSDHTNGRKIGKSCLTDELADYTQWSINNALRCISPTSPKEEIDPNILAIKLNRESNFNLAHHYEGGAGIAQTTTCARDEMMGCSPSPHCCNQKEASCKSKTCNRVSSGRKFMADTLSNSFNNYNKLLNPKNNPNLAESTNRNNPCKPYKNIFDHDQELENINNNEMGERRLFDVGPENKCQSLSLEEGLHRNLLNGLGLYLFYRDHGDESATGLLQNTLGLNESNSDFKKIRDYLTLGMYGAAGRNGATIIFNGLVADLKRKMRDGKLTFEEFKSTLTGPNGIQYLKDIEKSAQISFKDIGQGDPSCAY